MDISMAACGEVPVGRDVIELQRMDCSETGKVGTRCGRDVVGCDHRVAMLLCEVHQGAIN